MPFFMNFQRPDFHPISQVSQQQIYVKKTLKANMVNKILERLSAKHQ